MGSGHVTLERTKSNTQSLPATRNRQMDHRFYTGMACTMALGVFAGFSRTYFAKPIYHSPPLPLWVHIHGAVFTAWILFYLAQNLLAMNAGMKLHRRLGITGALLATAVVFLGMAITVRQAHQGRAFPFPDIYSLIAVSAAQMALFAALITAGLLWRRDGERHKRLMLMSSQIFFFPAFGRLLQGINLTTLSLALCLFFAGPLYDLITQRRIHPAYRWGVPLLVLTMPPCSVAASHAPMWRHFVDRLLA